MARILKVDDLWVKIFVPETEIGKVRLDQAVEVTVDSYPDRRFRGKIYYIASQSEFTPRNVQSIDERAGTRSSRSRSASTTPPPKASSSRAWPPPCTCRCTEPPSHGLRTSSESDGPVLEDEAGKPLKVSAVPCDQTTACVKSDGRDPEIHTADVQSQGSQGIGAIHR